MVRTGTRAGDESVYAVAGQFKQLGMIQRASVFDPRRPAWGKSSCDELVREFAATPDTSGGSFEAKLGRQLEKVSDDARLLMAELLTLHLLITTTVGAPKKRETIGIALDRMDPPPGIPSDVVDALSQGFVNPGTRFNTNRPAQLRFLVRVAAHFATLDVGRLEAAATDAWEFRSEIDIVELDGAPEQRLSLLHLMFPNQFEAIVSVGQRERVISYFATRDDFDPSGDDDRDLATIRSLISDRYGEGFDFYSPRLKPLWNQGSDPWAALVRWAERIYRTETFDEHERDFKIGAVGGLDDLEQAIRDGGDWLEPLRRLQSSGSGLIDYRAADDFLKWARDQPEVARSAIMKLWDSKEPVRRRVQGFADAIAKGVKSPGNRTAQSAYLLMATNPTDFPMYRPEPFKDFLALVGAAARSAEGDRYAQAIQTCDELQAELKDRLNLELRDRLDAQSLIWSITKAKPDDALLSDWTPADRAEFFRWRDGVAPTDQPAVGAPAPEVAVEGEQEGSAALEDRLSSAAAKTHLPVSYLSGLCSLLTESDKKQIVLYGPPGTGKTFVAQQLAYVISGKDPEIVQFHPSTTYEDFFEGIRPVTRDGSISYEVVKGPMAALAEEAKEHPERSFVLLIDELNRANVAKVLGEMLFLFEYRGVGVRTLYRGDKKFSLPPNLYVIATMNTVDRSVALVDAAMRRRFHFVPFYPDDADICDVLGSVCSEDEAWVEQFAKGVNERLVSEFGSRDYQLGWSHFIKAERTVAGIETMWRYNIEPLIEDHLFGEPERMKQFRWKNVYRQHVEGDTEMPAPHDDADDDADL